MNNLIIKQACFKGIAYIREKKLNDTNALFDEQGTQLKYSVYTVHDSIVIEGPKKEIVSEIKKIIENEITKLFKVETNYNPIVAVNDYSNRKGL